MIQWKLEKLTDVWLYKPSNFCKSSKSKTFRVSFSTIISKSSLNDLTVLSDVSSDLTFFPSNETMLILWVWDMGKDFSNPSNSKTFSVFPLVFETSGNSSFLMLSLSGFNSLLSPSKVIQSEDLFCSFSTFKLLQGDQSKMGHS